MPSRIRAFVRSKIGKKIFLAFFLIIAVPLICISLLSRQLSDFVLTKAIDQLLRDSTKSVALNLLDRLRSAEAMLRILDSSKIKNAYNDDAVKRGNVIFSKVSTESLPDGLHSDKPQIRVQSANGAAWPEVTMEIADPATRTLMTGVLSNDYLWENLDSGLYTMCVSGTDFAKPLCLGQDQPPISTVKVERPFYFRPYFEGQPWTLSAIAAPDIANYLPIRITQLFFYVAAAALLLTLSVSAFFIRRAITPLDALITATHAI